MPLSKIYGTGVGEEVTHNSNLDTQSPILPNTCAGVTSGDTEGEGWSIPPPRQGDGDLLRPFYPAQFPYFRDVSSTIKLSGYDWSMFHRANLVYPMISGGSFVVRSEYYTKHPLTQFQRIAFKYSFYRLNDPPNGSLRCIIFQAHDSDGPAFSILEARGGWIEFKMSKDGSNAGTLFFPIAEFTRETWHEITVFLTHGTEPSGVNAGRVTVWYGNKLARFHNRLGTIGNHTYVKAIVNQNGTGAYQTNPALGTTPMSTVDDGIPVTLFDYHGINFRPENDLSELSLKWGFYSSDRGTFCRPVAEAIDRLESGLYSHDESILKNPDDPNGSFYMPPNQRIFDMYSHMRFAYWVNGETDEDIWKLLNDGQSPLEAPSDFTWNLDPSDEFSLTVTTTTGGTVSQSPAGTSFTAGTSITLTATADSGFVFSRYRNPSTNETLSTNAVYTFSKSASSQSIQAVFVSDVVIPPNQKKFFARKKPIV
jgi:hypothetical protein